MNNNYINKYTENYSNMKDEDLIRKIKSGDNDALDYILKKYQEVVNMKVSRYFIIGAEKEDIIQERVLIQKNKIHLNHLQTYVLKDN